MYTSVRMARWVIGSASPDYVLDPRSETEENKPIVQSLECGPKHKINVIYGTQSGFINPWQLFQQRSQSCKNSDFLKVEKGGEGSKSVPGHENNQIYNLRAINKSTLN